MPGKCKYEGCEGAIWGYGWCRKHAERIRKHGSPDGGVIKGTVEERFWRYVAKGGEGSCWDWTAAKDRHGYPRIGNPGRGTGVSKGHRVSYQIHHGLIPAGMIVMHKCDNPSCTNPDHLRLGTLKQNTADMLAKGRGRWGKREAQAATA